MESNKEQTTNNSGNSNLSEFEINNLVQTTYKKIAEWHNGIPTTLSLKYLSMEIIEDVAGEIFKHFGLNYTPGIQMDESAKKIFEAEKQKMNPDHANKNVDDMTEAELFAAIQRKKLESKNKPK